MLETALIAAGVAVLVSIAVGFVLTWEQRVRLRRLELALSDWEERLVKETRQRAGAASAAARRLNPVDEALIRQHTGAPIEDGGEPWWGGLVKK